MTAPKSKRPPAKKAPDRKRSSSSSSTARLKARLAEAEQTLDAIRAGHVDALVVYPEEGGEKVFTLQGADHSYRRLVETMREGAATLSSDGVVLYANAHLAETFGLPLERVIGSTLRHVVAQEDRARFEALIGTAAQQPCAGEVALQTSRGTVPAFVSATPSSDEGPVRVCIVVTDLTEQKRNEEVVAAERLAVSILDQAAEAIVVCDARTRVVRASRAAHRLAGRNPLERPFDEVFPLQVAGTTDASPLARALRGEMVQGVEADLKRPDGTTASIILAAGPLHNDRKQTLGSVVALTDVTSRKEAEQRYRFLADSMPQIVWAARPDGRLDYFNRRWWEYTGRAEGPSSQPIVHPDDLERTRERWAAAVASGDPYEIQYRLRRHDGSYRWHLGRALAQRDYGGRIVRWFGTCTDIDDQKRAEAMAEEANRLKDEFLTTVSHELRTPLTAILGWAQLLRSPRLDDSMREKGLDTLERSAKAQAQLIEDLLDVSRIMSGKLRLDVKPQHLRDVVLAAIDAARPAADAKGVELQVLLDDGVDLVLGDPVRLQQVAWNLLSNAIKFTPRDGHVNVALRRDGSMMELLVRDDGAGIAPEFLPFVFDRFRQGDSSITRSKTGLGLGLSIVRHLTELHGGTVDVHSDGVGKGAEFRVHFPIAVSTWRNTPTTAEDAPDERIAARPSDPRIDLGGVSVLVVDDEADAREMLSFLLTQYGASVKTAASAVDALQALDEHGPHVLVSDIGMPLEDGYTLIRKVRARGDDRNGQVPAVALTAYSRAEDRTRALRAGFQTHLSKPVEPLELALVVARLAGR